jgi:hypothetical protein
MINCKNIRGGTTEQLCNITTWIGDSGMSPNDDGMMNRKNTHGGMHARPVSKNSYMAAANRDH